MSSSQSSSVLWETVCFGDSLRLTNRRARWELVFRWKQVRRLECTSFFFLSVTRSRSVITYSDSRHCSQRLTTSHSIDCTFHFFTAHIVIVGQHISLFLTPPAFDMWNSFCFSGETNGEWWTMKTNYGVRESLRKSNHRHVYELYREVLLSFSAGISVTFLDSLWLLHSWSLWS